MIFLWFCTTLWKLGVPNPPASPPSISIRCLINTFPLLGPIVKLSFWLMAFEYKLPFSSGKDRPLKPTILRDPWLSGLGPLIPTLLTYTRLITQMGTSQRSSCLIYVWLHQTSNKRMIISYYSNKLFDLIPRGKGIPPQNDRNKEMGEPKA